MVNHFKVVSLWKPLQLLRPDGVVPGYDQIHPEAGIWIPHKDLHQWAGGARHFQLHPGEPGASPGTLLQWQVRVLRGTGNASRWNSTFREHKAHQICSTGSSTWRWSPWCLRIRCSKSATLRTSPPHTPSSGTAPSLQVCSTTQVNVNRSLCLCVCVCINRRSFGFRFSSRQFQPTGDSY